MFRLRKETDCAIRFLKALSKQKHGPFSLNAAATQIRASFMFLQKVARKLRVAGIIASTQGVEGGYRLAIPPHHLNLRQIVEAVEGKYGVLPCLCGGECKESRSCQLKVSMEKVNKKMMHIFEKAKLRDM